MIFQTKVLLTVTHDSNYSESDCDEGVQINLHNLDITNTDSSTEKMMTGFKFWIIMQIKAIHPQYVHQ